MSLSGTLKTFQTFSLRYFVDFRNAILNNAGMDLYSLLEFLQHLAAILKTLSALSNFGKSGLDILKKHTKPIMIQLGHNLFDTKVYKTSFLNTRLSFFACFY